MRLRCFLCGLVTLAVIVISISPATADPLYDNGPPDTSYGPVVFSLTGSDAVADSFTLSSNTTLTGGRIALWVNSLYLFPPPSWSVQWQIGTSVQSMYNGTASLTDTSTGNTLNGYTLFESSFPLSTPSPLAPGTYWLTLTNLLNNDPYP